MKTWQKEIVGNIAGRGSVKNKIRILEERA